MHNFSVRFFYNRWLECALDLLVLYLAPEFCSWGTVGGFWHDFTFFHPSCMARCLRLFFPLNGLVYWFGHFLFYFVAYILMCLVSLQRLFCVHLCLMRESFLLYAFKPAFSPHSWSVSFFSCVCSALVLVPQSLCVPCVNHLLPVVL